jgi:hypothetical protein
MGLLSSRTFRQIATGALTGIEEKREDMRNRIDTYREKAVNKKNEIQKKYNEYYDEEKANINTFKTVATAAGDDYLPALNSFVGTDPSRLSIFDRMNANEIRTELDKYKDAAPADTGFIQSRQESLKLKESELNQNLQDQVGLFKGTSTLFTRDIEDRGVKDIQAEAGTLESQRLKTDFTAGAGIGLKTSLKLSEVQNNFSIYDNYYMDEVNKIGDKTGNRVVNPQFADNVAQIDKQADTLIDNGFGGNRTQAIAEIVEMMNNPSYRGDALQFLNNAVDGSPILLDTEEAFSAAIENRDIKLMENLIKDLENRNRPDEVKMYTDRLEQFKKDEANLSAETIKQRALEGSTDTITGGIQVAKDKKEESDKLVDFQVDKPKFKKEYRDILPYREWSALSEDKVKEIYDKLDKERGVKKSKALSTEGLSESDAAVVDKINTALGLS